MLTIRTTTLLATIATTQAVDYFKASCTKVEAGTVFIDQFGNGKKTVVGPANNCLIVGSSIIKCTGCGSSADCKIYDHTANAPCTVASADQSAKSMITCDESIPGTAINLQKFVDDDDCSGTCKFLLFLLPVINHNCIGSLEEKITPIDKFFLFSFIIYYVCPYHCAYNNVSLI